MLRAHDRSVSVRVGVSVALRQAAGHFISSQIKSLTAEMVTVYDNKIVVTMPTTDYEI